MPIILIWSGLMMVSIIGLSKAVKKRRKQPAYKFFAQQFQDTVAVKESRKKTW